MKFQPVNHNKGKLYILKNSLNVVLSIKEIEGKPNLVRTLI
jgi:hypothetical protein